jgi:two-component system copper resistance phosphate regulon response regulator CusR
MRILIVEDEHGVANFMRRGLESSSYTVDYAESGEEALDLLKTTDYGAIILDLALPGIDGIDVVREIRRRRLSTPVLAVTARAEPEQHVKGLDAGCDVYLPKPFAFRELLARLRAIQRRTAPNERLMTCGRLTLDVGSRSVTLRGRRVELTDREFELLSCLMRQPGKVVSRSELLEAVWGTQGGRSNVLAVYINMLRQKLCPVEGSRLIRTAHGVGYWLEDGGG